MLPRLAQADLLLLMAEEDGCYWCQKWYDEIGIIYPKTVEGKIAPIWSFNIHTELLGRHFIQRPDIHANLYSDR